MLVRFPAPHFRNALQAAQSVSDDVVVVVDSLGDFETDDLGVFRGVRVYRRALISFADQRQYGVALARHDWVLHVDSDEIVSADLAAELLDMTGDVRSVYSVSLQTYIWGCPLRHLFANERFVRLHSKGMRWVGDVHETLDVEGKLVAKLMGRVNHFTVGSLDEWLEKTRRYVKLEAQRIAGSGHSRINILWRPVYRFLKYLLWERGILDGYPGIIASLLGFVYEVLLYVSVWELNGVYKA